MTSPSFVRRVKANAEHLLGLVRAVEDREYQSLDAEWHNFLQAIEFGLEYEEALAETAELWKALIGFIESRGYFWAWHLVTRKVAEKIPDLRPEQACRVANEAGFFLEKVKDLDLALALHTAALETAEAAGDAFERALAILGTGNVGLSLRRYDEAERNIREAVGILDQLDEGRLHYSSGVELLGIMATNRGDYKQAEGWFEESIRGYQEAGHHRKAANSLVNLARAQDLDGDHHGSIATLFAARDLLKPGIDLIAWTNVHNSLGTAYFHTEDYIRAKEAFMAIDQRNLEEFGLHHELMWTTNNLGNVALKEKDWTRAIEYLDNSIRLARSLGEGIGRGNTLGDLAEALLHLGERDAARAALDEAVDALQGYPEHAWARKRLAAILAQRKAAFGDSE